MYFEHGEHFLPPILLRYADLQGPCDGWRHLLKNQLAAYQHPAIEVLERARPLAVVLRDAPRLALHDSGAIDRGVAAEEALGLLRRDFARWLIQDIYNGQQEVRRQEVELFGAALAVPLDCSFTLMLAAVSGGRTAGVRLGHDQQTVLMRFAQDALPEEIAELLSSIPAHARCKYVDAANSTGMTALHFLPFFQTVYRGVAAELVRQGASLDSCLNLQIDGIIPQPVSVAHLAVIMGKPQLASELAAFDPALYVGKAGRHLLTYRPMDTGQQMVDFLKLGQHTGVEQASLMIVLSNAPVPRRGAGPMQSSLIIPVPDLLQVKAAVNIAAQAIGLSAPYGEAAWALSRFPIASSLAVRPVSLH